MVAFTFNRDFAHKELNNLRHPISAAMSRLMSGECFNRKSAQCGQVKLANIINSPS